MIPLISETEIAEVVKRLAQEIDQDYGDRPIVVLAVLKGAFIFAADLVRVIQTPIRSVEFIQASSYGSAKVSSGRVSVSLGLAAEVVANQDVIVVEDIIDTGTTTAKIFQDLQTYHPASLKLCALLNKPDRRKVHVPIHYVGITVPDRFIIGYGIDFDQQYRQLPGIYALEE